MAYSPAGFLFAIAALGAFLIHQPLKITVKDHLKGRRPPRTIFAERFLIVYAIIAIIPLFYLVLSQELIFLIPVCLAIPFALIQLYYDFKNQSRHLIPETAGAMALAMIAPSIVILGGVNLQTALVLWLILIMRSIPTVLYVRKRLARSHGQPMSPYFTLILHTVALILVCLIVWLSSLTPLAILAFSILWIRAYRGLIHPGNEPAKIVGIRELFYGIATAVLVALPF
ncbi:YwiC-like family protein [Anaerolineales bacterium]